MALQSYYPNAVGICRSLSAIYSTTMVSRIKKVFLNSLLHAASFGISCITFQHSSRYTVHTAGCRFFSFYSFYVFRLTPLVMYSLSVR